MVNFCIHPLSHDVAWLYHKNSQSEYFSQSASAITWTKDEQRTLKCLGVRPDVLHEAVLSEGLQDLAEVVQTVGATSYVPQGFVLLHRVPTQKVTGSGLQQRDMKANAVCWTEHTTTETFLSKIPSIEACEQMELSFDTI